MGSSNLIVLFNTESRRSQRPLAEKISCAQRVQGSPDFAMFLFNDPVEVKFLIMAMLCSQVRVAVESTQTG